MRAWSNCATEASTASCGADGAKHSVQAAGMRKRVPSGRITVSFSWPWCVTASKTRSD